ncbi:hypothetical protein [Algicella marina]|uniref:Uncharacterized protein n=1 Tax=Algicella marina TaxID=2683284 RepID=A0A6P1SYK8_9RHOB|nr:hypothetical protein [Algicella marina]QHQ34710.1 hypothetical protein GO499_05640 [Algicella marina]
MLRVFCVVGLCGLMSAPAVLAGDEVHLVSPDKALSITGRLTATDEDSYTIETVIGTLTLPMDGTICKGSACPSEPEIPVMVNARPGGIVDLTGANLEVSGRLLSFSDQTYTVETKIGPLRIPAPGITCTGAACPQAATVPLSHLPPALRRSAGS